jgi:uncharacterized lipoprotein YajG
MNKPILAVLLALVFFASCRKQQELRPQTTNSQQVQVQNNLILASQE